MAKEKVVLTVKGECFRADKTKNGSTIIIAANVQQTEKGPASRTAVNIIVPDVKAAGPFDPGKRYTVTVTED